MGPVDAAKLSALFEAHAATLALYARQWLDPPENEDIVQDVFIRLMAQSSEPANARAWLFRSVRNAAISRLRSRRRRRRRERHLAADRPGWFSERTQDLIDAKTAQAMLAELPQRQREVIVLRIWGGLTLREIGEVVGTAVSTALRLYRTGLEALQERLGSRCTRTND